jgi:hypothetical protein
MEIDGNTQRPRILTSLRIAILRLKEEMEERKRMELLLTSKINLHTIGYTDLANEIDVLHDHLNILRAPPTSLSSFLLNPTRMCMKKKRMPTPLVPMRTRTTLST